MGVLAAVAVRRAQVAGQDETKRDKNGQSAVLVARQTMFGGSAVRCRLLAFE